jgi:hypothetical protein
MQPSVRDIYGRVTTSNPYLGYFVHAPSAGNVGAKYFHESVTEESDWQRQKALRNKPNSGWFHPQPGSYSRLHHRYSKANTYFTRQSSTSSASHIVPSTDHNNNNNNDDDTNTSSTTSSFISTTTNTLSPPTTLTPSSPASATAADRINMMLTAKLQEASAKIYTTTQKSLSFKRPTSRSIPPRNGNGGHRLSVVTASPTTSNNSKNTTIPSPLMSSSALSTLSTSSSSGPMYQTQQGRIMSPRFAQLQKVEQRGRSQSDMTTTTSTTKNLQTSSNTARRTSSKVAIDTPPGFHMRTGSMPMPMPALSLNNKSSITSPFVRASPLSSYSIRSTNSDPSSDGVAKKRSRPKSINLAKAMVATTTSTSTSTTTSTSKTTATRSKHGPSSYSQHDVVGRGALHTRRRNAGGRPKVASVDMSHFDPEILKRRGGGSDSTKGGHHRRARNNHTSYDSAISDPSVRAKAIARDDFGRRIQNTGDRPTTNKHTIDITDALYMSTTPTFLFAQNVAARRTSNSSSFDKTKATLKRWGNERDCSTGDDVGSVHGGSGTSEGEKSRGGSRGRSTSYVISPSHTPSGSQSAAANWTESSSSPGGNGIGNMRDDVTIGGGSGGRSGGDNNRGRNVGRGKNGGDGNAAWPEGGKYAMVSGGARKAPSIEQLKPWTVQTEAEITDKYIIEESQILGEGSYSRVYSATHRELGGVFAVKRIEKAFLVSEEEKTSLKREVELHLRLHHPHIVRLYEVYEDPRCLWLVMECTSQGTLASLCDYAGRLESEELACKLVHQIVKAVQYLHSNGILHSDIKPDNVVVDRPNGGEFGTSTTPIVKLCDFGLAKKVPNVKYFKYTRDVHKVPFTGVCGTPGYIAPELLQRQPYGISTDMWSIGIILYELISGRPPFRPAARCLERSVTFEGVKWRNASKEVIDFVQRLLVVDASQRMSAKEALKHAWFSKFGIGWLSEPRVM